MSIWMADEGACMLAEDEAAAQVLGMTPLPPAPLPPPGSQMPGVLAASGLVQSQLHNLPPAM